MSAPIFVASLGTFWRVPVLVSRIVREVHLPHIMYNTKHTWMNGSGLDFYLYDNLPTGADIHTLVEEFSHF